MFKITVPFAGLKFGAGPGALIGGGVMKQPARQFGAWELHDTMQLVVVKVSKRGLKSRSGSNDIGGGGLCQSSAALGSNSRSASGKLSCGGNGDQIGRFALGRAQIASTGSPRCSIGAAAPSSVIVMVGGAFPTCIGHHQRCSYRANFHGGGVRPKSFR